MSRMKAKKRRIMTKLNRKKRWRQAAKVKHVDTVDPTSPTPQTLVHPSAYRKQKRDVSNF